MALFSRRGKTALPPGILGNLAAYGAATLDMRSGRQIDSGFGWEFVGPVVNILRGPQADLAIQELHDAGLGAADPLVMIGSYSLLSEWDPTSEDQRFLELQDSYLDYVHERGYSSGHLTGYEAGRWIKVHGDLRSSFDGIVDVVVPDPEEAPPVSGLDVGENKLLALTGPLPDGNAFYGERANDGTYVIFSERQRSNEDPTRSRYDESYLGTFKSLPDLLRALGEMFGARPYWADPDLEPYFPSRRS